MRKYLVCNIVVALTTILSLMAHTPRKLHSCRIFLQRFIAAVFVIDLCKRHAEVPHEAFALTRLNSPNEHLSTYLSLSLLAHCVDVWVCAYVGGSYSLEVCGSYDMAPSSPSTRRVPTCQPLATN